jgi:hypothetical protein
MDTYFPLASTDVRTMPFELSVADFCNSAQVAQAAGDNRFMRPLAVFDIDGTLVDSRASIHRAACEAARDIGLPEPDYDPMRLSTENLSRFAALFKIG